MVATENTYRDRWNRGLASQRRVKKLEFATVEPRVSRCKCMCAWVRGGGCAASSSPMQGGRRRLAVLPRIWHAVESLVVGVWSVHSAQGTLRSQ